MESEDKDDRKHNGENKQPKLPAEIEDEESSVRIEHSPIDSFQTNTKEKASPSQKREEEKMPESYTYKDLVASSDQFCWNCGKQITNPTLLWCEKCRAPLDEDIKLKILSRTEPTVSVKCWRCGATTSGNICGICGSPLTRAGLAQMTKQVEEATIDLTGAIAVISPKDRSMKPIPVTFEEITSTISNYVEIIDSRLVEQLGPEILVKRPENVKEVFEKLHADPLFVDNNLKVLIRNERISPGSKEIIIRLYYWESESPKERYKLRNIGWNIALFLATILTVSLAGYGMVRDSYDLYAIQGSMALDIFLFTLALMGILTIHEFGHFIISRLKKVDVSLPYFIPVPSIPGLFTTLGTFGALIRQKEPISSRDDLFDIGFAGPLAGFVVAVPVYIGGLALTYVVDKPADYTPPDPSTVPTVLLDIFLQWFGFATGIIPSYDPDTQLLLQHPVMFAGWIGFILTGLNLMPASQLDGGHTSRAAFGDKPHRILTIVSAMILIINPTTMIFGLLIAFMGMFQAHPGPIDDVSPVHWSKYILISLGFVIAITCIPWPIGLILSLFGGGG